jgi:hypothetical protein
MRFGFGTWAREKPLWFSGRVTALSICWTEIRSAKLNPASRQVQQTEITT